MERDTQTHRHIKSKRDIYYVFDVNTLVADHGGVTKMARMAGVKRQTVYRWIRQGHISTNVIELLLSINPRLNITSYFVRID